MGLNRQLPELTTRQAAEATYEISWASVRGLCEKDVTLPVASCELPGPHLAKLHKVNEWTLENKSQVERESCFCSSKVELIHCVSMFFWVSFIFLIFFQDCV